MKWERVRGTKYREVTLIAGWLRLEVDRLNNEKWKASVAEFVVWNENFDTIEQAKAAAWNEAARKVENAHVAMFFGPD